jgi:hypothetical protein
MPWVSLFSADVIHQLLLVLASCSRWWYTPCWYWHRVAGGGTRGAGTGIVLQVVVHAVLVREYRRTVPSLVRRAAHRPTCILPQLGGVAQRFCIFLPSSFLQRWRLCHMWSPLCRPAVAPKHLCRSDLCVRHLVTTLVAGPSRLPHGWWRDTGPLPRPLGSKGRAGHGQHKRLASPAASPCPATVL